MKRLLLFDIDGTLMRTKGLGKRAIDQTFLERYGWENATDGVSFAGATDPWILREVFVRHGRTPAEADADQAEFLRVYANHLEGIVDREREGCVRLPGVLPLLRHLASRQDCVLALLTGNIREGARIKLTAIELWEHFTLGAYGDDAERREDLLPVALARAEPDHGTLSPAQTVVIGDTTRDMAVAHAHGARGVAVCTGFCPREDLVASRPHALLDDLSDLDLALDALLG
jgi:phosphoglycolate phosphatase